MTCNESQFAMKQIGFLTKFHHHFLLVLLGVRSPLTLFAKFAGAIGKRRDGFKGRMRMRQRGRNERDKSRESEAIPIYTQFRLAQLCLIHPK